MYNQEKFNSLRLIRSPNIGPVTFFNLINHYGDASNAIEAINHKQHRFNLISKDLIYKEIEQTIKHKGRIILYNEEEYPPLLRLIEDFPPVISILGDNFVPSQKERYISIIGSRSCSIGGQKFAEKLTSELVAMNFVIVSGMAMGIDSIAHHSCLTHKGKTIAVLGSGLSNLYPNPKLAQEIINNNGIIISEFPFNEEPKPHNFPKRNRIISGLSAGTLIIEAKINSGSMITANFALNQGRALFAVPGFPIDPRSAGPNKLIKEGAIMVRNIHDIINELYQSHLIEESNLFNPISQHSNSLSNIDLLQKRILENLNCKFGIDIDDIMNLFSDISFSAILVAISDLETKALIKKLSCGKIILS